MPWQFSPGRPMRPYEHRHVIALEETNLVGNVYFANHIRWQGRCREMFVRQYAPDVLEELQNGLKLVTMRVTCEYFDELYAFDEILMRMYARALEPGRVTMSFDYFRIQGSAEQLVAKGEQRIASMRHTEGGPVAVPLPTQLHEALLRFRGE